MTATCLPHGAPSVATCARCGVFLCEQDVRPLDAHTYCAACVARPDVDYLEAYRLQYFDRRNDGWSWLFGVSGVVNLVGAVLAAVSLAGGFAGSTDSVAVLALLAAFGGLQLAWFFKQRWARLGLPLAFCAWAAWLLTQVEPLMVLPALLVPGVVLATAFVNVRSQLFFGLEVPRERLRRDWSLYHDNRIARAAASLGVVGLILPFFPVPALVCGVIGLRRVDPLARPPVGNRRAALAGIVLGCLGIVEWGLIAFGGIR